MTRRSATDEQLGPMIRDVFAEMIDELPPAPSDAPSTRAETVLAHRSTTPRAVRTVALVAACLVLVAGLAWIGSRPGNESATTTTPDATSPNGSRPATAAPTPWEDGVRLIVYMGAEASDASLQAVREHLARLSSIVDDDGIRYLGPDESLDEARRLLVDDPITLNLLSVENVPTAFYVTPFDGVTYNELLSAADELAQNPDVLRVDVDPGGRPPIPDLPPPSANNESTSGDVTSPNATTPTVELWADLAPDTVMTIPESPLSGRIAPAAVWTGTEMLIWSGSALATPSGEIPLADGAAFNPTTGMWRTIATAPIEGRSYPAAIWTGTEMIVWGGSSNGQTLAGGAAYDPAADTWRTLPAAPIDSAMKSTALWTGDEVIVLGGMRTVSPGGAEAIADGAAYNPATDQWRILPPLPGTSLPPYPQAVWTGSAVIATVATQPNGPAAADQYQRVRYRPGDTTWEVVDDDTTATVLVATPGLDGIAAVALTYEANAPIELLDRNGGLTATTDGRPSNLDGQGHYGLPVWTGNEILFWSGNDLGWAVQPNTNRWRTFPAGNLANRVDGAGVWANGIMLTWGGFISNRDGTTTGGADGIVYRPPAD